MVFQLAKKLRFLLGDLQRPSGFIGPNSLAGFLSPVDGGPAQIRPNFRASTRRSGCCQGTAAAQGRPKCPDRAIRSRGKRIRARVWGAWIWCLGEYAGCLRLPRYEPQPKAKIMFSCAQSWKLGQKFNDHAEHTSTARTYLHPGRMQHRVAQ